MSWRALDVALSGTALALGWPVVLGLALAVRLDSPGPAFFVQERVGREKRRIRVVKLRTMVVDAERVGPAVTTARDPRVTRVGRWLRRTKLDELPQLWNVLRGDMSVVGPRPEVPAYVASYRQEWERLFDVRPGLTDLASIVFRDEERLLANAVDRERAYTEIVMPAKLALALRGADQRTTLAYFKTVFHTLIAVACRSTYGADVVADVKRRIAQQEVQ